MKQLIRSISYARHGILNAWSRELNFRIEVAIGLLAITLAILLKAGLVYILICTMLVLALELFNSSLESLVDLQTSQISFAAKNAKDYAAAAVLIASVGSVAVGICVLGPPLIVWIFSWL